MSNPWGAVEVLGEEIDRLEADRAKMLMRLAVQVSQELPTGASWDVSSELLEGAIQQRSISINAMYDAVEVIVLRNHAQLRG